MRTDVPNQEPETNPLLLAALRVVEAKITSLFDSRANAEYEVKTLREDIDVCNTEIEEAETAKKFLQRAIVDSNEAQRYLGGNGS